MKTNILNECRIKQINLKWSEIYKEDGWKLGLFIKIRNKSNYIEKIEKAIIFIKDNISNKIKLIRYI